METNGIPEELPALPIEGYKHERLTSTLLILSPKKFHKNRLRGIIAYREEPGAFNGRTRLPDETSKDGQDFATFIEAWNYVVAMIVLGESRA